MNEEEKKAIKSMKRFVECKQDMTAVTASEMKTVLNLLEKKDKEIQLQKEINKTEQDRHKQTEKSLKGQLKKKDKQIEQYQNMLATNDMLHVLECEKKDKMIDEMAYYLSDFDIDEMCSKCDRCIGNGCYADDDMEFKIKCIKQYFERKVEEN